ncbi:MAG: hypothetical protein QXH03_08950 [Candidatus Bathyarchaeia archaeon]
MSIKERALIFLPLIVLVGCNNPNPIPVPIVELSLVELPEYGLDFSVVTDKKVYQVGEPITIGIKVKNTDKKPHTLRIAPGTDAKPYPMPYVVGYGILSYVGPDILGGFRRVQELTIDPITVTVLPNTEMQIEALNWVWQQDDELLKEQTGIETYYIAADIGRLDVDGHRVDEGIFYIDHGLAITSFSIIHPTTDILAKQHGIVFRGGAALIAEPNQPYRMLAGIENRSTEPKTVSLKPVGNYPTVRIRVFGPVRMKPYPPPRPPQVAVREIKEEITVTIDPKRIYTILDWKWDQRNSETGEMVPNGKRYMMVVEFCGLVEVNGQSIGVIETPLKVFGFRFDITEQKPVQHIDLRNSLNRRDKR